MNREKITVAVQVRAPLESVWQRWITPTDVMKWNSASDDWHTPSARNDLRVGGTFSYRMEARDGSFGFDFAGIYDEVVLRQKIAYRLTEDRKIVVEFSEQDGGVKVTETFDAETENPIEMQRNGWQAILNRFKLYVEGLQ